MPTRMDASGDRSSVKYMRMSNSKDEGYIDLQWKTQQSSKVPWKSIGVATVLLVFGTLLLVIGILLVTGHIDNKFRDRLWPVIVLGMIMFIPGFYHVRLAIYAYKGYRGYSFDDIPDYDD